MTNSMPSQGIDLKQGVYRTPGDFMTVVRANFPIVADLAASPENAQADRFYTEEVDALKQDWNAAGAGGWLWLNPPYDNIDKWAAKCCREMQAGARILFLVPASVGSNWYRKYVEDFAKPLYLNGRLIFDFRYPEDYVDARTAKRNLQLIQAGLPTILSPKAGKMNTDPYPKDLMLAIFDKDLYLERNTAGRTWDWDQEIEMRRLLVA